MTTSEYFATVNYNQRQQELIRRIERQRVAAERRGEGLSTRAPRRSARVTVAAWIGRLHSGLGHQTARS